MNEFTYFYKCGGVVMFLIMFCFIFYNILKDTAKHSIHYELTGYAKFYNTITGFSKGLFYGLVLGIFIGLLWPLALFVYIYQLLELN